MGKAKKKPTVGLGTWAEVQLSNRNKRKAAKSESIQVETKTRKVTINRPDGSTITQTVAVTRCQTMGSTHSDHTVKSNFKGGHV